MATRLAALCAALICAAAAATAAAAPTNTLTRARAEGAIAKKVKSSYRRRVGTREVQAGCKRVSARRFSCEYGVLTSASDQTDPQDRDPYKYEGTGSVKKNRSGKLVVRVSRPR